MRPSTATNRQGRWTYHIRQIPCHYPKRPNAVNRCNMNPTNSNVRAVHSDSSRQEGGSHDSRIGHARSAENRANSSNWTFLSPLHAVNRLARKSLHILASSVSLPASMVLAILSCWSEILHYWPSAPCSLYANFILCICCIDRGCTRVIAGLVQSRNPFCRVFRHVDNLDGVCCHAVTPKSCHYPHASERVDLALRNVEKRLLCWLM